MIENYDRLARSDSRALALECIEVGITACDPARLIQDQVSLKGERLTICGVPYDLSEVEDIVVVGGGKAAGQQALALETVLGDRIDRGAVVTNESVSHDSRITVYRGDHPVPSSRGVEHTDRIRTLAREAGTDDLVLVLLTGGASALLPAPVEDVGLADLQLVTEALLESGATIQEINTVRKHLSTLKGGGLAKIAAPASVVSLLMSDVVGDDLAVIGSGPTVPDESTYGDALDVLTRYEIDGPASVRRHLRAGMDGAEPETPTHTDQVFDRVDNHLLADGGTAMRAVHEHLETQGHSVLSLSSRIRGEAREAAKTHVAVAEEMQVSGHPLSPPAVVLSAGETTVTIRGDGNGGPNQEFALSAAIEMSGGITLAAVDTDGTDGPTTAAGGIVDSGTVTDRATAQAALQRNGAYDYLSDRDDCIVTGHTGTNVNDLRVMIVRSLD